MQVITTMKARIIATVSAGFLLAGCQSKMPCSGFDAAFDNTSPSTDGVINVSIDGSGSMKGFANVSDSSYHKTLELLDNALGISSALGFSQSQTNSYRIGREAGTNKFAANKVDILAARSPSFYEEQKGQWPKVSSMIDKFVSNNPSSIDVLISDLEPDNASIKQLLSAVLPKLEYSRKSTFLGITRTKSAPISLVLVGIKSQFTGGVFPVVQGTFPSFTYSGPRPFYVLVLGPTQQVEKLITRLASNKSLAPDIQITRFATSPDAGKTIFINSSSTLSPQNCLIPAATLSQGLSGKLMLQDASQRWIQAQRIRNCTAQQGNIIYGADSILGLGNIGSSPDILTSSNAVVTSSIFAPTGLKISTQFQLMPGTVNIMNIAIDTTKLDELQWEGWSTPGTKMEGNKTQRLLPLIQSIRSETDSKAKSSPAGSVYSPLRLCSAVKA